MGSLDRLPIVEVAISSLCAADSPRRSGESVIHTRALAESGALLPPIVVHRSTMRVVDGMHRLHAAKLRGADRIAVRFFDGDNADAFVAAVRANIRHGLPLSLADRKCAAARIIGSHPQWSDRAIASVTGVATGTVLILRGRPTKPDHRLDARVGRDGRVRPLNAALGRETASTLMAENPSASLREIGRKAGISPETARDVRARLCRGDRPLPPSQGGRVPAVPALRADPALRYTENGRALLRMLDACRIIEEHGKQLMADVPDHCRDRVAVAAHECAQAWQVFADSLNQRI
jgi:hypothetical protein